MSYSRFNTEDIVLSSDTISVPIWSNGSENLVQEELTTSSIQTVGLSSNYYLDVYNTGSDGGPDKVQFAIAYADIDGSGSTNYNSGVDGYSPSRTNYGQYRSLVLGDEESEFHFGETSETVSEYFWAISVDRARYRESLQAGALELILQDGPNFITLFDGGRYNEAVRYIDSGRVYNIYDSGSYSSTGNNAVYGYYLPDIGTILLDCKLLERYASASRFSSKVAGEDRPTDVAPNLKNSLNLCKAIHSFTLREQETITSNYVFVRAKNSEFNYSINPSSITSTGELRHSIMINQPETYITTVGLYNDANELLAVAKLSRPLSKNFSKEALIRIKLDY